eukprot:Clim_evm29s2 gene=Clim_evmTU29s2
MHWIRQLTRSRQNINWAWQVERRFHTTSSSALAACEGPTASCSPCAGKYDFVIVGGAVMGWSTAYWMKTLTQGSAKPPSVVVIERDSTYRHSTTAASLGGCRFQFSAAENVQMSQFGAAFLREINRHLGIAPSDPVDVGFLPRRYLFLGGERDQPHFRENVSVQRSCGVETEFLTPAETRDRYPWLAVDDLSLVLVGQEGEGWFDPLSLVHAFRCKAQSLGVDYIANDTVNGFTLDQQGTRITQCHTMTGLTIEPNVAVVNAVGGDAGAVARMAGIDDVDISRRKRQCMVFECKRNSDHPLPDIDTSPLVIDAAQDYLYFRREMSGLYVVGRSPKPGEDDPAIQDPTDPQSWELDYDLFENDWWPALAHRVPAFEGLRLVNGWIGHYDFHALDQNAVLGPHPEIGNFHFIAGFSGHGIQHAPAAGRLCAEQLLYGKTYLLDISPFRYDRIRNSSRTAEMNII